MDLGSRTSSSGKAQRLKRRDELGRVQFGASSIIVAFEAGRIEFDHDLLDISKRRIMTVVEVGMSFGQAKKAQATRAAETGCEDWRRAVSSSG